MFESYAVEERPLYDSLGTETFQFVGREPQLLPKVLIPLDHDLGVFPGLSTPSLAPYNTRVGTGISLTSDTP